MEQADALAERDRAESIAVAQREIAGPGQDECEDCGDRIPTARRAAAPGAIRCQPCQCAHELGQRAFRFPFFKPAR